MGTIRDAQVLLERSQRAGGRPAVIVLIGLPASGKSTAARALLNVLPSGKIFRSNRDDYRRMALASVSYSAMEEAVITAAQNNAIPPLLGLGVNVIVDDTNLITEFRTDLMRLARVMSAAYLEVTEFLLVPPDICITRDEQRPVAERVGSTVITKMWMDRVCDSALLTRALTDADLADTTTWSDTDDEN